MRFRCNNCSHKLSVSDKHAGKKATCPKCGQSLVIPKPVIKVTDASPKPKTSLDDLRLLDIPPEADLDVPAASRNRNRQNAGDTPKPSPNDLRLLEIPPTDLPDTPTDLPSKDQSKATTGRKPGSAPNDARFLGVPPADVSGSPDADGSEEAYKHLQSLQGGRIGRDREPAPERKLPWIVDIFLYPTNKAAVTILLICTGIPFLLRVMLTFFKVMTSYLQIMIILWLVSIIIHWALLIFLVLYMNWYIWECIRDSADGGIRGAETVGATPGLGAILGQAFKGTASLGLCLAPAILYLSRVRVFDGIFWMLFVLGGFAFPMALLSLVMHETVGALNPLLIVRSIGKTLVSYIALAPLCYALCLLFPLAYAIILDTRYWHWSYVLQFAAFYLMLVMAHLLGRFYFKNEEALYWDA